MKNFDFCRVDEFMQPFSVLMSVYSKTNSAYLDEAISSVWTAQELKPSELVIVYDGQVSQSVETVTKKWKKELGTLMVEVKIPRNGGLANALNKGLEKCSYELVARMDDDDVSLPSRFLCQIQYMMNHPDVAILGTQVEGCSQNLSNVLVKKKLPTNRKDIVNFSRYRCPFNHPSVMFRKSIIKKMGGYPRIYPEDYPLWVKIIACGYGVANLPQVLVHMRLEEAIYRRRGLKFLIGELRMFRFMYKIGHLSFPQFLLNCIIRSFVRLSPQFIKKKLYENMG